MTLDKTRPVRVLHIASGDLWAGAEVQLFTLAKALKNNTNTIVDIVLLNHGILEQKLLSCDINVIVIDESKLHGLAVLLRLIRITHQIQPDVIHTHRLKENILGCVAARLNGNIPSLRTSHGAPETPPSWRRLPNRIIHWLDFLCGRYLQRSIIAVSEDLADKLKKYFPSKKIHVIENGVDLQEMKSHCIDNQSGNSTGSFNVGFAGRLVPVKRVDIFIKTARYILDNYPELKTAYHIYGDGPLRNELERLNRKLKTDAAVSFEGHSDNISEKIQKMNALLITSDHEGLPMVLLETKALGTPIISHAVGGIPHLLDQGNCGILITENEPASYASAIRQLANDKEKVSDIIHQAKQRVEERYSSISNAQAYYSQYSSLLE